MRVGSRIRAAASEPEIEAEVQATLGEFFHKVGSAHELANRAVAILVFPTVVKAGFGRKQSYVPIVRPVIVRVHNPYREAFPDYRDVPW